VYCSRSPQPAADRGGSSDGSRYTTTALASSFSAIPTGYAYEPIPNKAIIAGATKGTDESLEEPEANLATPTRGPASLGILALGAPGLSICRREEPEGARLEPNYPSQPISNI